jgi:hypothetical protein
MQRSLSHRFDELFKDGIANACRLNSSAAAPASQARQTAL